MTDAWFKGLRDFDLKTAYEGLRKLPRINAHSWRKGPRTALMILRTRIYARFAKR